MKINTSFIVLQKIFLALILVLALGGAFFVTKTILYINKSIASAEEAARPAKIKITKITISDCADCFNIDNAVVDFKKQNVVVEEEKSIPFESPDAQALIKQFDIKKVPTYIASGEISKNNVSEFFKTNGEIKNDMFVFTKLIPLFVDTQTKKQIGMVSATILVDHSSTYFVDPKLVLEQYSKSGIKITKTRELSWQSAEAEQLIIKHKITKIPAFLLSSEADAYDALKAAWSQIGTIEQDKTYVARNISTPYRDVATGKIVGLVEAIYVTDSTCPDCYDPAVMQKNILVNNFGLAITSESKIDINSGDGKSLKQKYNISAVPTVILSPGADLYANLKRVWPSVGTIEKDGWYVFRQMNQLGGVIYKDLTKNTIIRPEAQTP